MTKNSLAHLDEIHTREQTSIQTFLQFQYRSLIQVRQSRLLFEFHCFYPRLWLHKPIHRQSDPTPNVNPSRYTEHLDWTIKTGNLVLISSRADSKEGVPEKRRDGGRSRKKKAPRPRSYMYDCKYMRIQSHKMPITSPTRAGCRNALITREGKTTLGVNVMRIVEWGSFEYLQISHRIRSL